MKEDVIETTPKPNPLTTVTPLSKALALILFVTLPFVGFYLGVRYQNLVSLSTPTAVVNNNLVNRPVNTFANLVQPQTPSTSTINDEVAGWKIYKTNSIQFRYPSIFRVDERVQDFFAIVEDKGGVGTDEAITIDNRRLDTYGDYNFTVESEQKNLVDIKLTKISNGVKISGTVGPGPNQGIKFIEALLNDNGEAVQLFTLDNGSIYTKYFDQILSTFKFL